jgi:hypothetical protein
MIANEANKKLITELEGDKAQIMADFLSEVSASQIRLALMLRDHRSSIDKTYIRNAKRSTYFTYSPNLQSRLRCSHDPLSSRVYNATLASMSLQAGAGSSTKENTRMNQSASKPFTSTKGPLTDVK